ncbi:MAG: lectin-like protein [Myxococcota bacterium]
MLRWKARSCVLPLRRRRPLLGLVLLSALLAVGCKISRQGSGGSDSGQFPSDASCIPSQEICDGNDNDCRPETADGVDDPMVGTPCDGVDEDECEEGVLACISGSLVCEDFSNNTPEVCGGDDEDCDGIIDEAVGEVRLAYPDSDGDGYGAGVGEEISCTIQLGFANRDGDCNEGDISINPGAMEVCNGTDEDCDEIIDEGAGCACTDETFGGRRYRFCTELRDWRDARDSCREQDNFNLASIQDVGQNNWIHSRLAAYGPGRNFWIGYRDLGMEGDWGWIDGSPSGYENWRMGEPNGSIFENCAEMSADGNPQWNDAECRDNNNMYVCEGPE